ncbi:MAG TPA: STAS domain-containing protein [bacterium]|nr:STAS domain-containing protein [bacterium]
MDRAHRRKGLECRSEEIRGATTIHVSGELDISARDILGQTLEVALDLGKPICLVLKDVTYIDSGGIGLFFRYLRKASMRGVYLAVANPSHIARLVMEIAALDLHLTVFPDVETFLQRIDGPIGHAHLEKPAGGHSEVG